MKLIDYLNNANPFSVAIGFLSGVVAMIYLFVLNVKTITGILSYSTFSLSVLFVSTFFGTGVFFILQFFTSAVEANTKKQ